MWIFQCRRNLRFLYVYKLKAAVPYNQIPKLAKLDTNGNLQTPEICNLKTAFGNRFLCTGFIFSPLGLYIYFGFRMFWRRTRTHVIRLSDSSVLLLWYRLIRLWWMRLQLSCVSCTTPWDLANCSIQATSCFWSDHIQETASENSLYSLGLLW